MKESTRIAFSRVIAALISLTISFFSCYYVLDDIFIPSLVMNWGRLCFRLFIGYLLFLTFEWIQNRSMTRHKFLTIFYVYTILVIALLLSREPLRASIPLYNFSLGVFEDVSPIIPFVNIFIYVPIGFMFLDLLKGKWIWGMLPSITMVFIIELTQALLRVGKFDVNDIVLNILGICIGFFSYHLLKKHILCRFSVKSLLSQEP